jgi:hypothetical protein
MGLMRIGYAFVDLIRKQYTTIRGKVVTVKICMNLLGTET